MYELPFKGLYGFIESYRDKSDNVTGINILDLGNATLVGQGVLNFKSVMSDLKKKRRGDRANKVKYWKRARSALTDFSNRLGLYK